MVFTVRYGLGLCIQFRLIFGFKAAPWLRRLDTGLSRKGPGSILGQSK